MLKPRIYQSLKSSNSFFPTTSKANVQIFTGSSSQIEEMILMKFGISTSVQKQNGKIIIVVKHGSQHCIKPFVDYMCMPEWTYLIMKKEKNYTIIIDNHVEK